MSKEYIPFDVLYQRELKRVNTDKKDCYKVDQLNNINPFIIIVAIPEVTGAFRTYQFRSFLYDIPCGYIPVKCQSDSQIENCSIAYCVNQNKQLLIDHCDSFVRRYEIDKYVIIEDQIVFIRNADTNENTKIERFNQSQIDHYLKLIDPSIMIDNKGKLINKLLKFTELHQ